MKSWEPFLTGFLQNNDYIGRPVDLLVMKDGSLLVSDDHAGAVYRVSYGGGAADALPARGAIGTRLRDHVEAGAIELLTGFSVQAIRRTADGRVAVSDRTGLTVSADRIVSATGFRPDHSIAAVCVVGRGTELADLCALRG